MNCTQCNAVLPMRTIFCTNCKMYVPNEQPKLSQMAWMPLFLIGTPGIFFISALFYVIFTGKEDEGTMQAIGTVAIIPWIGYWCYHLYVTIINGLYFKCDHCRSQSIVPIHMCPRCASMNVRTDITKHAQGLIAGLVMIWISIIIFLWILSERDGYGFIEDICYLTAILITGFISIPLFYKIGEYRTEAIHLAQWVDEGHIKGHPDALIPPGEVRNAAEDRPAEQWRVRTEIPIIGGDERRSETGDDQDDGEDM